MSSHAIGIIAGAKGFTGDQFRVLFHFADGDLGDYVSMQPQWLASRCELTESKLLEIVRDMRDRHDALSGLAVRPSNYEDSHPGYVKGHIEWELLREKAK